MVRHSKNNTSSAQFTYAERARAKKDWGGTSTAELGSTAQRPWCACVLCLSPARRPTVDMCGHLFCRECVLSDLVSQRDEIARIQRALQVLHEGRSQREKELRAAAHARLIRDFESRQDLPSVVPPSGSGLEAGNTLPHKRKADESESQSGLPSGTTSPPTKRATTAVITTTSANGASSTSTQQSTRDRDFRSRAEAAAAQAEEEVRAQLAHEEEEAKKSKLPSFWLPSLTPSERQDAHQLGLWSEKDVPSKPMCRASRMPHHLTAKQLVDLQFWKPPKLAEPDRVHHAISNNNNSSSSSSSQQNDQDGTKGAGRELEPEEPTPLGAGCPTCQTLFVQATQTYVLRPCGHVLCRNCTSTLVLQPAGYKGTPESLARPSHKSLAPSSDPKSSPISSRIKAQCPFCDARLKDAAKDIVPLQREGTGYAASGNKTVFKKGIAFQG